MVQEVREFSHEELEEIVNAASNLIKTTSQQYASNNAYDDAPIFGELEDAFFALGTRYNSYLWLLEEHGFSIKKPLDTLSLDASYTTASLCADVIKALLYNSQLNQLDADYDNRVQQLLEETRKAAGDVLQKYMQKEQKTMERFSQNPSMETAQALVKQKRILDSIVDEFYFINICWIDDDVQLRQEERSEHVYQALQKIETAALAEFDAYLNGNASEQAYQRHEKALHDTARLLTLYDAVSANAVIEDYTAGQQYKAKDALVAELRNYREAINTAQFIWLRSISHREDKKDKENKEELQYAVRAVTQREETVKDLLSKTRGIFTITEHRAYIVSYEAIRNDSKHQIITNELYAPTHLFDDDTASTQRCLPTQTVSIPFGKKETVIRRTRDDWAENCRLSV